MKINFNKKSLFNLLPYLFVFIASIYRPWDSDLGWHLKYGEYFFGHWSILRENIYSSEMAGYLWPNTNWLTDVFTYAIFKTGGFLGLTIASAIIVTLTFWAFAKAYDLDFFQKAFIFPLLAVLESPINWLSFRGQQISILFLGLLFLFLERLSVRKRLIFIPLLFVVWVNTHGQYILGLAILVLYSGFKVLEYLLNEESKFSSGKVLEAIKANKNLLQVLGLSVVAGLINPFGIETYKIALSHLNTPELKFIMEYLPIDDLTDDWWKQMVYGIMLFFGALSLIFTGTIRENIPRVGVVSIFYLLAFWVRRYAWSMYYLGIPLLKPVANFLRPDSEKNAMRTATVLFIICISFTVYLKLPLTQFQQMNWDIYCREYNHCSEAAINYVKEHNLDKKLMTMYNWGGYMIWKHPEIKPSIDGRMTVWHDPETGYSPLSAYYAYETNEEDVSFSQYDTILMGNDKEIYNRLNELVEEGKWEKKFEDEFGGVFVRKKISH